jgi:SAM-dependent methyltransferase
MHPLRERLGALLAPFYPDLRITRSFPLFSTHCGSNRKIRAALIVRCAHELFPALGRLLDVTGQKIVPAPLSSDDLCVTPADRVRADELRELFFRHGSDKSSAHDYHKIYAALLARRDEPLRLLEIGLGSSDPTVVSNMGRSARPGASLRAFRDFLPRAEIFGADIDPKALFTEDRIRTFPVDQTDPSALERLGDAIGGKLDLIIDDGLHNAWANLNVLAFALGRLNPGGTLVIEDILAAHLPVWQVVLRLLPPGCTARLVACQSDYALLVTQMP